VEVSSDGSLYGTHDGWMKSTVHGDVRWGLGVIHDIWSLFKLSIEVLKSKQGLLDTTAPQTMMKPQLERFSPLIDLRLSLGAE